MIEGKVCALMATYGRYSRVCESLACFLLQDYEHRHLWILNNHPIPLQFDHPLVTVVNEGGKYPTLGHCRNRLLDFADGEFVRTHDDDDLWLPWAFSQGVEQIGSSLAWKPTRSWWYDGNKRTKASEVDCFELAHNNFEASVTWRTQFVKEIGYRTGEGDEHLPLLNALGPKLAHNEMHEWSSYCYRWACGEFHASGTLRNEATDEQRSAAWQLNNNDVRPGVPLSPAIDRVRHWYCKLAGKIQPESRRDWLNAAMRRSPVG